MTDIPTLRVAVIGCGYWGKNLIKNFAALKALVAVCDAHAETASAFASQYGVQALEWEEILASDGIDAVIIAAPAVLHVDLALQALNAGKHVFIEKPLALTVSEGEAVVKKAAEMRRTVMVGHILNYHPAFVKLKNMVDTGELGDIKHVQSSRLSLGKVRHEEDVLWSFAPHDISMVLSLLQQEPITVQSFSNAFLQKDIADTNILTMTFAQGKKAHIHTSWAHPFKEQRLIVTGDKAMAVFDDVKPWSEKLAVYTHGIDKTVVPPGTTKADPVFVMLEEKEPLLEECRHFIQSIEQGKAPMTDGYEGLRVLRVLEQAGNK